MKVACVWFRPEATHRKLDVIYEVVTRPCRQTARYPRLQEAVNEMPAS